MIDKFTKLYMRIARELAENNTACHSRHIGAVLVNQDNRIFSTGYNGAPSKFPHPDSKEYLTHFYNNLCTEKERSAIYFKYQVTNLGEFLEEFVDKKVCPRRILDIPSGERMEYCQCQHSERGCLTNANRIGVSTLGATIYCYCTVPCHECSIAIISAGIIKVVCLKSNKPDYSKSSRWLFQLANPPVELVEYDEREFD